MTLGNYCDIRREGGRIILEIPEEDMLAYFRRHDPEFPLIEDKQAFLDALLPRLLQVEHPTGDDHFTTGLEHLVRLAAHDAAQGAAD